MCPLWAKSRHRLFDHLVGASEERRRHGEAKCLGRFEIDHQLVLGWLLHRQVGWLLSLEDTSDIRGAAPPQVGVVNSIGNQASARHKEAVGIHGRQFRTRSQTYDQFTVHSRKWVCENNHPAIGLAGKCADCAVDYVRLAYVQRGNCRAKNSGGALNCSQLSAARRNCWVAEHTNTVHLWSNLFQGFEPLSTDSVINAGKAGRVTAGSR